MLAAVRRVFRTSQLRLGVGPNPFVAWVAARHAAAGGHVAIDADEAARVLAGMPISLLPMDLRMSQLLDALGVYTLGAFAAIGVDHVADRFGEAGVALHALSRGIDTSVVRPRLPEDPIEESLPFPEPVGNVDVLQRALRVLVERAVAHPRCVQHAPRSIVVACQLVRDAHVQAVVGDDALLQVLEVQPGSRVPERHVVLVPRGDGGGGAA